MSRSSRRRARLEVAAAKPIRAAKDDPKPFYLATGGACSVKAESGAGEDGKPKLPTFEGNAYTGQPMKPEGWGVPIIVDLDGVKVPSQHRPALRQHDPEQIVGHTESVKVDKAGIQVAGKLSGQAEHVDKVRVPASNGFQWQLSIGANPTRTSFLEAGETATVNGREVTGPMTIAHETEIGEISFVPLGADGDTSATVHGSKGKAEPTMNAKQALKFAKANGNLKAAKYNDDEIDKMSEDEAKANFKKCMADDDADTKAKAAKAAADEEEKAKAAKAAEGDEEKKDEEKAKARRRQTLAAEETRVDTIRAAVAKAGITHIERDGKKLSFAATAIGEGWTEDKVELEILRASRASAAAGNGPHLHFANRPDLSPAVMECAVLQAGRSMMRLEDKEFYLDSETGARRIPEWKERQIKAEYASRYPDQVQQAAHTIFRGQAGLQQVMIAAARQFGYSGSDRITDGNLEEVLRFGMGQGGMAFRAEPSSTMNIANILANVQQKFALVGYLFVEQAWREIASIRPTNDFKPTKSVNLLADTIVKQVPDNGELDDAALTDQAFANQVDQYGRMLTIGRKSIINDDLGILTTAPMQMGTGAGKGLNLLFWTVFLNLTSTTADDGNPFWANSAGGVAQGNHGTVAPPSIQKIGGSNLLAGGSSVLSSAALQIAKQMFDNQIDPLGNPLGFDGVPVLLFPPELWQVATELVDPAAIGLVLGAASTTRQPNVNLWKGRLKPVMSRYLNKSLTTLIPGNASPTTVNGTTTAWWTLYPAVAGVNAIEVAFLNGVDSPTVLTAGPDWNFNRLGISMRVVFDYGVNAQNFRAGVKSNGV